MANTVELPEDALAEQRADMRASIGQPDDYSKRPLIVNKITVIDGKEPYNAHSAMSAMREYLGGP